MIALEVSRCDDEDALRLGQEVARMRPAGSAAAQIIHIAESVRIERASPPALLRGAERLGGSEPR